MELDIFTPKKREVLQRLGINNIEQLLKYYPYRYELIYETKLEPNQKVIVEAQIVSQVKRANFRINQSRMAFNAKIHDQIVEVVVFNRHFLHSHLTLNKTIVVIGQFDNLKNQIIASDIKLSSIAQINGIYPVYRLKEGIKTKDLYDIFAKTFSTYSNFEDNLPENLISKYRFLSYQNAIINIHRPENEDSLKQALRRLKYEEIFYFQLGIQALKSKAQETKQPKQFDAQDLNELIKLLPFKLTSDQIKVSKEIFHDLSSSKAMYRLVQGDVGSGKTMVALLSMYASYLAGYQSALMVPTEILAVQHFETISQLLEKLDVHVRFLVGSMPKFEKDQLLEDLAKGKIDVVIATQAIIQDSVQFKNLGLVIADEQHRFGVKQRQLLKAKGNDVDYLLMSATPIPRTMAISLYGDLDVSTITSSFASKAKITTHYFQSKTLKPYLEEFIKYMDTKQQAYIVCPLIEESGSELRHVEGIYQGLKTYFKDKYRLGLIHGKMNDIEKKNVMEMFKNHELDILVSTTVIEVGISVVDANMMIIYDAHRFGLAQLHQLRGRVGRGYKPGTCVILSDNDNPLTIERLNVFKAESDGFKISELDLKLRGPGDLLGLKQSGLPTFQLVNLINDHVMVEYAKKDASAIYNQIEHYPYLQTYLNKIIDNDQEYLD